MSTLDRHTADATLGMLLLAGAEPVQNHAAVHKVERFCLALEGKVLRIQVHSAGDPFRPSYNSAKPIHEWVIEKRTTKGFSPWDWTEAPAEYQPDWGTVPAGTLQKFLVGV
jgi:hypothetical protein